MTKLRNATGPNTGVSELIHVFEEPGALERVAALAARWFVHHMPQ